MAKCYVKAFFDWIEQVSALEDDEKGRLFVAILEYARSGEVPDMQGRESILFPVFKSQIDRDMESSAKQSENGKKGGRPRAKTESEENQSKPKQTKRKPKQTKRKPTKANKEEEKEKDKEKDKDKEEDKEETPFSPPSQGDTPPRPQIPYDSIRDAYNEICASFPRCTAINESRKKAIRARFNAGYTLDDFRQLFHKAENSSFLRGRNDRNWSATFDWLVKDSNMAKVLEGNYDDSGAKSGPAPKQTQRQSWADLARQMDEEEGVS